MSERGKIRSPWFYVALSIVPGLGLIALGKRKELRAFLRILPLFAVVVIVSIWFDVIILIIFIPVLLAGTFLYPWQVAIRWSLIENGDPAAARKPWANLPSERKRLSQNERWQTRGLELVVNQFELESEDEIEYLVYGYLKSFWLRDTKSTYIALSKNQLLQIETARLDGRAFRVSIDPVETILKCDFIDGIFTDGLDLEFKDGTKRSYRTYPYFSKSAKALAKVLSGEEPAEELLGLDVR